jgi:hypothetical protein
MALQINLQVSENESYPEAYAHIVYVRSEPKETYIFVNIFKNRDERINSCVAVPRDQMQNRPKPIKQYEFVLPTESYGPGLVYPTAYSYIKTLPEFAGATDIIDPIVPEEQVL